MPTSPVLPASGSLALDLTAWLLTYALHSTILFGAVWVITSFVSSNTLKDVLWKSALVGGLLTATLQVGLDLRPFAGVVRLPAAVEEPAGFDNDLSRPVSSAPAGGPSSPAHGPGAGSLAALPDSHVSATTRTTVDGDRLSAEGVGAGGIIGAVGGSISRHWLTLAMLAWLLGAGFGLLRLAWTRLRFFRSLGDRQPVPPGPLTAMLDRLRRRAGIRRTISLTTAPGLSGPVALGHHEICLPGRALTDLEPGHQEGMLAHELAHLQRHDPAWLLTSGIIEAFFFFQPLNRVGRRRLQETTEYLCDEWAVRQTGRHLTLARCLAQVASWLESGRQPAPIASMARLGSPLIRRIQSLVDGRHRRGSELPARWRAALGLTPLLVVGLLAPGVSAWSDAATLQEAPAAPEAGEAAADEEAPAPPSAPTVSATPAPRAEVAVRVRSSERAVSRSRAVSVARARAVVEATVEAPEDGSGHSVRLRRDDDNLQLDWRDDDQQLTLKFHGEVSFSDDGTEVESVSPGGSLRVEESRGADHRLLTVTSGGGGELEYDYSVDGETRPFDPEGRRWLTETLARWQALREARDQARAVRDAERARMAEYRTEMSERQREIARLQRERQREIAHLQREDHERLREEAREQHEVMRIAEMEQRHIERELQRDQRRAQDEAMRAYRQAEEVMRQAEEEAARLEQDPERREEALREAGQVLAEAREALERAQEDSIRREDELTAQRREIEQIRRQDIERQRAEMRALREESRQRQRELRDVQRAETEEIRRRLQEEREELRREMEESGEDGPYVYLPLPADAPHAAVMPEMPPAPPAPDILSSPGIHPVPMAPLPDVTIATLPALVAPAPELVPSPESRPVVLAPLPDVQILMEPAPLPEPPALAEPVPLPELAPLPESVPMPDAPELPEAPPLPPMPEALELPEAPPLPPAPEAPEDDEDRREMI